MVEDSARVLLAEDDVLVQRAVVRTLATANYRCEVAGTAAELLELLRVHSFDLVLADIGLPDDSDLAFLTAMESGSRPPIILMTGSPRLETAIEAVKAGVVDYLLKPVDPDELISTVRRAVSWRRAANAVEAAQQASAECTAALHRANVALRDGMRPIGDAGAAGPNPVPTRRLTEREQEIVDCLISGMRVEDIATKLSRSSSTVRNHLQSVFRKYGVSSQVELLARLRP